MGGIISGKLSQAAAILARSDLDIWMTFDRETSEGGDPALPFLVDGGLTWQSALIVTRSGRKIAVVGNYDAGPLEASNHWDEVVQYVQSIREPLLGVLEAEIPDQGTSPRIGVNFSESDDKADGLSHGLYRALAGYLEGTRFAGSLVSAEALVAELRSRKTPAELACIRAAVHETDRIFGEIPQIARPGMSEVELYRLIQARIGERGLGYSWDRRGDPIVNSGPDSMIGHGIPSAEIRIAPGHILHLDLGVLKDDYGSDLQACWYVPHPGESEPPEPVVKALKAVTGAISTGAVALRPGVEGWQVDAAAREFILAAGYPEYKHALGHQVGRLAHDGGGILGPRWERYGRTPYLPVMEDQVYTLELGVMVPGHGYLGLEEMVCVRGSGLEWMRPRQMEMPLLNVNAT